MESLGLEKALSIYGEPGGDIDTPVKHKDELKSEFIAAVDELLSYVSELGVDIDQIRSADDVSSRLKLLWMLETHWFKAKM